MRLQLSVRICKTFGSKELFFSLARHTDRLFGLTRLNKSDLLTGDLSATEEVSAVETEGPK